MLYKLLVSKIKTIIYQTELKIAVSKYSNEFNEYFDTFDLVVLCSTQWQNNLSNLIVLLNYNIKIQTNGQNFIKDVYLYLPDPNIFDVLVIFLSVCLILRCCPR